ncbi:hypothetical protein AAMO2058_001260000 [Amorphochlora amoebiformis]
METTHPDSLGADVAREGRTPPRLNAHGTINPHPQHTTSRAQILQSSLRREVDEGAYQGAHKVDYEGTHKGACEGPHKEDHEHKESKAETRSSRRHPGEPDMNVGASLKTDSKASLENTPEAVPLIPPYQSQHSSRSKLSSHITSRSQSLFFTGGDSRDGHGDIDDHQNYRWCFGDCAWGWGCAWAWAWAWVSWIGGWLFVPYDLGEEAFRQFERMASRAFGYFWRYPELIVVRHSEAWIFWKLLHSLAVLCACSLIPLLCASIVRENRLTWIIVCTCDVIFILDVLLSMVSLAKSSTADCLDSSSNNSSNNNSNSTINNTTSSQHPSHSLRNRIWRYLKSKQMLVDLVSQAPQVLRALITLTAILTLLKEAVPNPYTLLAQGDPYPDHLPFPYDWNPNTPQRHTSSPDKGKGQGQFQGLRQQQSSSTTLSWIGLYAQGAFFGSTIDEIFDAMCHAVDSPYLRLTQIIRITNLHAFLVDMESSALQSYSTTEWAQFVRKVRHMAAVAFGLHFAATGWIIVAKLEHFMLQIEQSNEWVPPMSLINHPSASKRYMRALYWALATVTGVGDGGASIPDTWVEFAFTLTLMGFGVTIYATIISEISSNLTKGDSRSENFRERMTQVMEFIEESCIPQGLRKRITKCLQHQFASEQNYHDSIIPTPLRGLPKYLQDEVLMYFNRDIVTKVPLFKECQPGFVLRLVQRLKPQVCLKGDYLIKQGDPANCMYFIRHGEMEVIVNGMCMAFLKTGDFTGEIGLISASASRTASVRALRLCELYLLEKTDFDQVVEAFPEELKRILHKASKRAKQNKLMKDSVEIFNQAGWRGAGSRRTLGLKANPYDDKLSPGTRASRWGVHVDTKIDTCPSTSPDGEEDRGSFHGPPYREQWHDPCLLVNKSTRALLDLGSGSLDFDLDRFGESDDWNGESNGDWNGGVSKLLTGATTPKSARSGFIPMPRTRSDPSIDAVGLGVAQGVERGFPAQGVAAASTSCPQRARGVSEVENGISISSTVCPVGELRSSPRDGIPSQRHSAQRRPGVRRKSMPPGLEWGKRAMTITINNKNRDNQTLKLRKFQSMRTVLEEPEEPQVQVQERLPHTLDNQFHNSNPLPKPKLKPKVLVRSSKADRKGSPRAHPQGPRPLAHVENERLQKMCDSLDTSTCSDEIPVDSTTMSTTSRESKDPRSGRDRSGRGWQGPSVSPPHHHARSLFHAYRRLDGADVSNASVLLRRIRSKGSRRCRSLSPVDTRSGECNGSESARSSHSHLRSRTFNGYNGKTGSRRGSIAS